MSIILSLKKTPIQAIYETTALDIIRELSSSLADDKPIEESFTSYHGIDVAVEEINFNNGIKTAITKYHDPGKRALAWMGKDTYSKLPSNIEISKIGNFDISIQQAMEIVKDIVKTAGDSLYGALLVNRKHKTFNPFHPVIMHEIMKKNNKIDKDKKEYTLALYSWKDRESFKAEHKDLFIEDKNFQTEIAQLIVSLSDSTEYVTENKNFNVDIQDDKFILKYTEIKVSKTTGEEITGKDTEGRNFIVPCQIINIGGIAFPYYGTVYSKKGLAWGITPMLSANVNDATSSSGSSVEYGSKICTHSGNSKTQQGISALNHSNTTSPLNKYILRKGAFEYAHTCLVSAIGLYHEGFEVKEEPKPEKALTFQEFKTNNPESTKKDYLIYVKNRLDSKISNTINLETLTYPVWDSETEYNTGAIVLDTHYSKDTHPNGQLRELQENGRWIDYIQPINLENTTIKI